MIDTLYRSVVYPLYHVFQRDGVNEAIRQYKETQWYTEKDLEILQQKKLADLLEFAYKYVPYYNSQIDKIGLSPNALVRPDKFRNLPLLTKDTIRKNLDDLTARPLKGNKLLANSTSGSTGEPLSFYTDSRSSSARKAAVVRNKEWAGLRIGEKEVKLWGSPVDEKATLKLRGRLHGWVTRQRFLSSYELTEERMETYVSIINSFRPTLLLSYPGPLEVFANYCRSKNVSFDSLEGIITSAETLWSYQRELIEDVFKVRIFNRYGCREVGDVAQECELHSGLHINSERVYVEIVDEQGRPCEPGEAGEILITDLDNFGMPFVRYRVGDGATWAANQKCECGRNLPLLSEIEGRTLEVVSTPSGKSLGGTFWTMLLRARPGIKQFQVVQDEKDVVRIRYVRGEGLEKSSFDFFEKKIEEGCGSDLRVKFEEVPLIAETAAGKRRLIISKIGEAPKR